MQTNFQTSLFTITKAANQHAITLAICPSLIPVFAPTLALTLNAIPYHNICIQYSHPSQPAFITIYYYCNSTTNNAFFSFKQKLIYLTTP
jgi:hypothetical protein